MVLTLPRHPLIIAHRGAWRTGQGNTVTTLNRAAVHGADMIEVDVQLTADGVPVLWHDADLEDLLGHRDPVAAIRYDDLRRLERERRQRGSRHRLATLVEADRKISPRLPFNIEIKPQGLQPEAVANALEPLLEGGRAVLVSSFDWALLEGLRRLLPRLPLAPLGLESASDLVAAAEDLDAFSIHASTALASSLLGGSCPVTRPLFFFTVNDVRAARRLTDLGSQGLFTDRPSRLRRALRPG